MDFRRIIDRKMPEARRNNRRIIEVTLQKRRVKASHFGSGCEGRDSNSRTPTRLGPQPSAFDLAWLPSHGIYPEVCTAMKRINLAQGPQPGPFDSAWLPSLSCHYKKVVYLIKTCDSQGFFCMVNGKSCDLARGFCMGTESRGHAGPCDEYHPSLPGA